MYEGAREGNMRDINSFKDDINLIINITRQEHKCQIKI